MAHEITNTDNVLLVGQPAWHNLGLVVDSTLPPTEGIKTAGLGWTVEKVPLYGVVGADSGTPNRIPLDSHVGIVRSDTQTYLGVVGAAWEPVQNLALAEFAEALASVDKKVELETCGSIRGGRKVWLLCRAGAFEVGKGDVVKPYLLLANAHDGTMSLRATFTSIRVVCSNTLHMVVPEGRANRYKEAGFRFHHTRKLSDRVEEAKQMLRQFGQFNSAFQDQCKTLQRKPLNRKQIEQFFTDMYVKHVAEIPLEPKNPREHRKKDQAMEAVFTMSQTFDRERDMAGATAWNAHNAFTSYLQHERARDSEDSRLDSNLFGDAAKASADSMVAALRL